MKNSSYKERSKTPYLEAFINEVLRYGSISPLAAHATEEETVLGEYRIPKKSVVIGNIWGMHFDTKVIDKYLCYSFMLMYVQFN